MRLPLDDRSAFVIGIDLGTTNSALAQADPSPDGAPGTRVQRVTQLVNPGEVADLPLLPSFLYLPGDADFAPGALALPWQSSGRLVVGELARRRGEESPVRLVTSAKSWLSYAGIDRTAPVLPWQAPAEIPHLSPVDVSAAYLEHLREAWDYGRQDGRRLADQDVVLTVPASFDEEARELTRRAAARAGLEQHTLLEEPQAAFYAWLDAEGDRWRDRVRVGDVVLVCDVGGGTTDFSLIAVSEEQGDLVLERLAVGEHILLGGDNMDLALARLVQQQLTTAGHRIDSWQLQSLWHQCRAAKEALFARPDLAAYPVTIRGRGTRLVGGTIRWELQRADLDAVLVEGFFPRVPPDAMPERRRRVGIQELGLAYAADAGVTRHLARFLRQELPRSQAAERVRRGPSGLACPTHILFNGGVMKAAPLRDRLVAVVNEWLAADGAPAIDAPHLLGTDDLELAVARGAASYGRVRNGGGVRIRAGAPRTYYIGIESAMPAVPGLPAPLKALCVVPFGMEEGSEQEIPHREFGLLVGESAEFRFLTSPSRKDDPLGSLIEDWGDDLEELSPLEVALPASEAQGQALVPVRLVSRITELGTLELWCVSRDGTHRWKLELNIRTRDPEAA